jgi:hypothetical protein
LFDQFEVKIESSSELITAEAVPLEKDELAKRKWKSGYSVNVTVPPSVPVGKMTETLTITGTGDGKEKTLKVTVTGFRSGPYRILSTPQAVWYNDRSLLDFGTISSEKKNSISVPFFATNFHEGEFKFLDVKCDVPGINVRLEPDKDEIGGENRYRLIIDFPEGRRMNHNAPPFAKLSVKTNHPVAPELEVFLKFVSL